jgi:hypothetical protein
MCSPERSTISFIIAIPMVNDLALIRYIVLSKAPSGPISFSIIWSSTGSNGGRRPDFETSEIPI